MRSGPPVKSCWLKAEEEKAVLIKQEELWKGRQEVKRKNRSFRLLTSLSSEVARINSVPMAMWPHALVPGGMGSLLSSSW